MSVWLIVTNESYNINFDVRFSTWEVDSVALRGGVLLVSVKYKLNLEAFFGCTCRGVNQIQNQYLELFVLHFGLVSAFVSMFYSDWCAKRFN